MKIFVAVVFSFIVGFGVGLGSINCPYISKFLDKCCCNGCSCCAGCCAGKTCTCKVCNCCMCCKKDTCCK